MKFNKESFRKDLVLKRVVDLNLTVESAASEIDITPEELSGLESGNVPNMDQFCKVCSWLKSSRPGKYFQSETVTRDQGFKIEDDVTEAQRALGTEDLKK